MKSVNEFPCLCPPAALTASPASAVVAKDDILIGDHL